MIRTLAFILIASASAFADTKVLLPDMDLFADSAKNIFVETTIPGNFTTPEGIAAALLTLSDQASNKKLIYPFIPQTIESTSGGKDALPLASYFRGARLEKDILIISFSGEAMRYLNSTSAIQTLVKGSIEETLLLHFPKAKEVQYEIDGEIIVEWDA